MFTTYGIFHPQSCICVYIGQTGNFKERCKAHRTAHRERKAKKGSLQYWLKELHNAKLKPNIVGLEVVQTERESLASEEKWVEIFTQIGHPLRNGWIEHKDITTKKKPLVSDQPSKAMPPELVALEFGEDTPKRWGRAELNRHKTGYRLTLADEKTIIDLVPPTDKDSDTKLVTASLIEQFRRSLE